jgi:hypothetical protein
MQKDLPSTGDTQAISSVPEHHGFVDSCIALIENLLDDRSLPAVEPEPSSSADI